MCDKAVDVCLPALKFVPDWSVTNKMLKNVMLYFVMMILLFFIRILIMPLF